MKNAGAHAVMQYLPYMTKLFHALAVVIVLLSFSCRCEALIVVVVVHQEQLS